METQTVILTTEEISSIAKKVFENLKNENISFAEAIRQSIKVGGSISSIFDLK